MTINVGDKLPEAKFRVMTAEGPQVKTTDDIFKGKKVALFAVPGAYTGTCHKMHLHYHILNPSSYFANYISSPTNNSTV